MTTQTEQDLDAAGFNAPVRGTYNEKILDPSAIYSRADFTKKFKSFTKVNSAHSRIWQGKGSDAKAVEDLANEVGVPASHYSDYTATRLQQESDIINSTLESAVRGYVATNEGEFISMADKDKKNYVAVVGKVPNYKTAGTEPEHDALASAHEVVGELEKILGEEDQSQRLKKMQEVVQKVTENSKISPVSRNLMAFFGTTQQDLVSMFNQNYASKKKALGKIMTPDRARSFFMKNMEIARNGYDKMPTGTPEEVAEKQKMISDALAPYRLALANIVYSVEKPEQEKEDDLSNPAKKKSDELDAELKAKRLPLP